MSKLIEDYLRDMEASQKLSESHREELKAIREPVNAEIQRLQSQASKLKSKVWELGRELQEKETDMERKYREKQTELHKSRIRLEDAINIFKIPDDAEADELDTGIIQYKEERYYGDNNKTEAKEDLGYIKSTKHLKVNLFIVSNIKPVNCYSLIAVFSVSHYYLDLQNGWRHGYGSADIKPRLSPDPDKYGDKYKSMWLKDSSSISELMSYAERQRKAKKKAKRYQRIFDIITMIEERIAWMEEVKSKYTVEDILDLRLLPQLESRSSITYTDMEKNSGYISAWKNYDQEQDVKALIELEDRTLKVHSPIKISALDHFLFAKLVDIVYVED